MGGDAALVNPIIKTSYEVMSELDGGELNLSGLSHLTQYPEYSDVGRLGELMSAFESKEEILNLVSGHTEDKVNVYLGSESSVSVMDQSALIFKPIKRGGKTVGAIGVIGPLRMDYAKVLATIESLCGNISDLIDDGESPMPPNMGLLNDKNN
jgi:heat-inducible transcriptional repressor